MRNIIAKEVIFEINSTNIENFKIIEFYTKGDSAGLCIKQQNSRALYSNPILSYPAKRGYVEFIIKSNDSTLTFFHFRTSSMKIFQRSYLGYNFEFKKISFQEFRELSKKD